MLNVFSLSVMSLAFAACAVEDPPEAPEETPNDQIAIPDELPPELGEEGVDGTPYATRYCVDQSYASADRVSCDPWFLTCFQPNWETQLSRNHPVHIRESMCGGTYVHVYSLWNQVCYAVRRDALRAC